MSLSSNDKRQGSSRGMFGRLADQYDLLNRLISFHFDTFWRKKAVEALALRRRDPVVLDLGSGTGDPSLTAAREIKDGTIIGLDFSLRMLQLAQEKKRRLPYGRRTAFILGSALAPPFKDEVFDAVMTAFVLRNIPDLNLFFRQAYRLLRPGGRRGSRACPQPLSVSLRIPREIWSGGCRQTSSWGRWSAGAAERGLYEWRRL